MRTHSGAVCQIKVRGTIVLLTTCSPHDFIRPYASILTAQRQTCFARCLASIGIRQRRRIGSDRKRHDSNVTLSIDAAPFTGRRQFISCCYCADCRSGWFLSSNSGAAPKTLLPMSINWRRIRYRGSRGRNRRHCDDPGEIGAAARFLQNAGCSFRAAG
jgi:hypothetical protein